LDIGPATRDECTGHQTDGAGCRAVSGKRQRTRERARQGKRSNERRKITRWTNATKTAKLWSNEARISWQGKRSRKRRPWKR